MKKLLFGVIVFVILFILFPKVIGSLTLLGIVGIIMSDFVTEKY